MPRRMHAHSVMLKPELSSVSRTGPQHERGAVMHSSQVSKGEKQVVTSKTCGRESFFFFFFSVQGHYTFHRRRNDNLIFR